jgi:hypothetical protein
VRARAIYRRVQQARDQQDNEQWHLFILEDMLDQRERPIGRLRYRFLPQMIAFFYYQVACSCSVADVYGRHESFADVLRHIALDVRAHKDESIEELAELARKRRERSAAKGRRRHTSPQVCLIPPEPHLVNSCATDCGTSSRVGLDP